MLTRERGGGGGGGREREREKIFHFAKPRNLTVKAAAGDNFNVQLCTYSEIFNKISMQHRMIINLYIYTQPK